jgi:hypothetical protein
MDRLQRYLATIPPIVRKQKADIVLHHLALFHPLTFKPHGITPVVCVVWCNWGSATWNAAVEVYLSPGMPSSSTTFSPKVHSTPTK